MKNNNDDNFCSGCVDRNRCTIQCDLGIGNTLSEADDYKEIISEIQEAKENRRLSYIPDISGIEDAQIKAICAMLFFDIPVSVMAKMSGLDESGIYKKLKKQKKIDKTVNFPSVMAALGQAASRTQEKLGVRPFLKK